MYACHGNDVLQQLFRSVMADVCAAVEGRFG